MQASAAVKCKRGPGAGERRLGGGKRGWGGGLLLAALLGGDLWGVEGEARNTSAGRRVVLREGGLRETGVGVGSTCLVRGMMAGTNAREDNHQKGQGVSLPHRGGSHPLLMFGGGGGGRPGRTPVRCQPADKHVAVTEASAGRATPETGRQRGRGDGVVEDRGLEELLADDQAAGELTGTSRAAAGDKVLRVVAVNVGTIALMGRTAGGAVGRATPGFLAGNANANLRRLLEWMRRRQPPPATARVVAAFVLSSTMLPRAHLPQVLTEFKGAGYEC